MRKIAYSIFLSTVILFCSKNIATAADYSVTPLNQYFQTTNSAFFCSEIGGALVSFPAGFPIHVTGVTSNGYWQIEYNGNIFYMTAASLVASEINNNPLNITQEITDWTHFRFNGQEYVISLSNGSLASDYMSYTTTLTASREKEYVEYWRNSKVKFNIGTDYYIDQLYDQFPMTISTDCPPEYLEAWEGARYGRKRIGNVHYGILDGILESSYNSHLSYIYTEVDCSAYASFEWIYGAAVGKEAAPVLDKIKKQYGKFSSISSIRRGVGSQDNHYTYYKKTFDSTRYFAIEVDDYGIIHSILIANGR